MKTQLIKDFEKLLEDNQIPFMEILESKEATIDLEIKFYFPKIIKNVCKFLDDKFTLENKENLSMKKDESGYHQVDIFFDYKNKRIGLCLKSMLQNTWGIANNL